MFIEDYYPYIILKETTELVIYKLHKGTVLYRNLDQVYFRTADIINPDAYAETCDSMVVFAGEIGNLQFDIVASRFNGEAWSNGTLLKEIINE